MAYKVIEADSAEKLTQLVVADGQGAIGGVTVANGVVTGIVLS